MRAIGSSKMSAAQVREADAVAAERGLARFVTAQNHYNLLERDAEEELVPACEELGIGLIPFFPLATRAADREVPPRAPAPARARG